MDKKKAQAAKKKLTNQQKKLEEQIAEFPVKTYSGIWPTDVTTADWKDKSGGIAAKKAYFKDKLAFGELTPEEAVEAARNAASKEGCNIVDKIGSHPMTPEEVDALVTGKTLPPAEYDIVAFDFGIKYNILRQLRVNGFRVTVVPAHTTAEEVLAMNPDGVFLSNGPGDPATLTDIHREVAALIGKVPMFGICLGHQIISHALGAKTFKLKFGHRGANHPVKDLKTGKISITSQNHGFAVDPDTVPDNVEITLINLNDNTVEGIAHRTLPVFSVQYHPEAAPGPRDPQYLFRDFRKMIAASKRQHAR